VIGYAIGDTVWYRGAEYLIARIVDVEHVGIRIRGEPVQTVSINEVGGAPPKADDDPETLDIRGVSDADWWVANKRYSDIKPLVEQGSRRSAATVAMRATEVGQSQSSLYRWIRLFGTTGKISALLPVGSSGGRGKARLKAPIETALDDTITHFYLDEKRSVRPSITETLEDLSRRCKARGLKLPSRKALCRRIDWAIEQGNLERRSGRRIIAPMARSTAHDDLLTGGEIGGAEVPLALTQIDHTLLNVMVVDDTYRLSIGRPWITVLFDVFSRMVLGFYVSLDHPSAGSVGRCLFHALQPKEQWLERIGAQVRWPAWGKPRTIHADNAKEFRGTMLLRACQEYLMNLEWRPVKKPRYGAHIERWMGTLSDALRSLAGATGASPVERGDYDSEKEAQFTLKELECRLTLIITKYHNQVHSTIGCTPINRWTEGLLGTPQRPGIGLPARFEDAERLRLDFLPYVTRSIRPGGFVEVHNIAYYGDVLRGFEELREPASPRKRQKFIFAFDERDMRKLHFFAPTHNRYYDIAYKNPGRPGVSTWELSRATRLINQQNREPDENALFDAVDQMRRQDARIAESNKAARRSVQRRKNNSEIPESTEHAKSQPGDITRSIALPEEEDLSPGLGGTLLPPPIDVVLPSDVTPFSEIQRLGHSRSAE